VLRLPSQTVRPAQSPIEIYLREINETPLLNAEEERERAYRIEEGDTEARGTSLSLQDLIEEGDHGLLRATETFDSP
jgi:RNA polymerase primary sigma factor